MSDKILTERANGVTTLRLNDPQAMNAMTSDMAQQLHALLQSESKTARAIILAGSERAFCAGANLNAAMPEDITGFDVGRTLEEDYNPLMQTIRDLPVPVVSAVRGAAAGVGASLEIGRAHV